MSEEAKGWVAFAGLIVVLALGITLIVCWRYGQDTRAFIAAGYEQRAQPGIDYPVWVKADSAR